MDEYREIVARHYRLAVEIAEIALELAIVERNK